jgi:hypothetical protein
MLKGLLLLLILLWNATDSGDSFAPTGIKKVTTIGKSTRRGFKS